METRYLRGFLKIAETGSITRAADSLGISQPSLSQQLLRLEDEVGVALFSRNARGVTLTESGRRFLNHARSLLEGVNSAFEDARESGDDAVGEVILAVPYSVSRMAGLALCDAMAERAPQVRFRLVEAMTAQIWGWLEEAKVTLGLVNYLGPRKKLTFSRIAAEELLLAGPAGKFASGGQIAQVNKQFLSQVGLILPGFPHSLRQVIDQEAARNSVRLEVTSDVDALAVILELVATGRGYSILPRSALAAPLADGRLSVARISDANFSRQLALVRNSTTVVAHASVVCEKIVRDVLTGMIAGGTWIADVATE